ncbi:MAG TPA: SpoIIE family protein phosphatase [Streptosporangiaceae bacterium]
MVNGVETTASEPEETPSASPPPSVPSAVPAAESSAVLQQALLPAALPLLPQASIAARYLSAATAGAAGGDWFDAVPLPQGRVALAVGDVMGRGVTAAAGMGQLRAVLGELLATEPDVAAVLARIERFAARNPALRAATLALAVLDPADGAIRYTTCGHPLPLVIGSASGGTRFLARTGNGPLGVGARAVLADERLLPGELLLMYTDGLIERPGQTLTEGAARLAEAAAAAMRGAAGRPGPAGHSDAERTMADWVCERIVELMTRAGHPDDATVLAVQRLTTPVPDVHARLPCEPASLSTIRRALDDWLARLQATQDDRDALHMAVVEIVTNAIEHAYPAGQAGVLEFDASLHADGRIECRVTDYGRWHPPDPTAADRGNGLMVADHMVDQMQITHPALVPGAAAGAPGTVVTMLHRSGRPTVVTPARPPVSSHNQVRDTDPAATAGETRPPLLVDARLDGGSALAAVHGPVDATTAGRFLRRLLAASRAGTLSLTVDLGGATCLAGAGVSALYRLAARLAANGNHLVVVAPSASPAHPVLELAGFPHRGKREPVVADLA